MKFLYSLFLVIFMMPSLGALTPPYEKVFQDPDLNYVFDLKALPVIRLEVSQEQWNTLLRAFDLKSDTQQVVKAQFTFTKNGQTEVLDDIGLRLRGNTSRYRPEGRKPALHKPENTPWNHAHYGLKFSEFDSKTRFHSLENMTLKFFKDDPSYVREIYGYDLMKRFGVWLVPWASYARVFIRVTGDSKEGYLGIYRMVEAVDEVFIEKRFGKKDDGDLWKCSVKNRIAASLTNESLTLGAGISTDTQDFAYDLKTNKKQFPLALGRLKQWTQELNSFKGIELQEWIQKKLGGDLFLRTLAVLATLGSFDDYWNGGNNFYFYLDSHEKAWFIPFDLDNIMGTSVVLEDTGTQNPLTWGPPSGRPLVNKLLEFPEYTQLYSQYLKDIIDPQKGLFLEKSAQGLFRNWHELIQAFVDNDTGRDDVIEDLPADWSDHGNYRLWEEGEDTRNFFQTRTEALRQALFLP